MKLASRLSKVRVSATVEISNQARALRAAGHDVISLGAGEPNFDTPENIQVAAQRAMQSGETHYTMVEGIVPLREAICAKLARDNNVECDPSSVIVCAGGKQVIYNAMMASLEPGDEVIIPAPYWVSYPDIPLLFGGEPVIVQTSAKSAFKITPAQLSSAITEKTRWVFLNSPSNPTGTVYSREELVALGEIILTHPNIMVMTDDIYEKILYTDTPFVNFCEAVPEMQSRTLIVNGLSKSHAMTGWRLGYGVTNQELIAGMKKIQGQSTLAPCSISQWAAVEALNGPQDRAAEMASIFAQRRNSTLSAIHAIDDLECFEPGGAFYLFVSVEKQLGGTSAGGKTLERDTDWVMALMEEQGVSVVPGSAFGTDGYFRLSFAASESDLEEACQRIATFCRGVS